MSVHGRVLVLKINHQLHSLPRSVRTIVAGGRGFAITGAAIKACIAENIELLISDDAAAFVSLFAEPRCDASRASLTVRSRQFAAVADPIRTTKIARAIVTMKVKAEGHAPLVKRDFLAGLKAARTTDDVRHIEAKAAQVWWRQWAEFEMRFAGTGEPADWHSWPGRYDKLGELAAQFTARDAIHPMQALHNYAIGIAAARMTRVVIVRGLDACYGFLHDGRKPGKLSLVWDCIEPLRPELVRAVFGYAGGRVFRKDDFAVFEGGIVRLKGEIIRKVAELALAAAPIRECVKVVQWLERQL